ncbi:MAG: 4-hydroxythreonine-4-phosphate dehydrogenase PdxA [Desulfobacterales bacterium]
MKNNLPIIGITMGDPVGVGPEIILSALQKPSIYRLCNPLVIGDIKRLNAAKKVIKSNLTFKKILTVEDAKFEHGCIDVMTLSEPASDHAVWGKPTVQTASAMVAYIFTAIDLATQGAINATVTCPINKHAMKTTGIKYPGHTELFADRTGTTDFVMMLAGQHLKVVPATIHIPLKQVPRILSRELIAKTIRITGRSLRERFGIENARIAVAGLNPHAGEGGLFGEEEKKVIIPAIRLAEHGTYRVSGPFPPDTVFHYASKGKFDVVISMYHDQGLIPFKMIHFADGVNTTLGLPIIRTSVDHGTAYDIAGTGKANPTSLIAAIQMAVEQVENENRHVSKAENRCSN